MEIYLVLIFLLFFWFQDKAKNNPWSNQGVVCNLKKKKICIWQWKKSWLPSEQRANPCQCRIFKPTTSSPPPDRSARATNRLPPLELSMQLFLMPPLLLLERMYRKKKSVPGFPTQLPTISRLNSSVQQFVVVVAKQRVEVQSYLSRKRRGALQAHCCRQQLLALARSGTTAPKLSSTIFSREIKWF